MGWESLIGTGAQVAGNAIGNRQSDADRAKAQELYAQALQRYLDLQAPGADQTDIASSAQAGVTADPALVAAQRAALAKMGQVERSGGLTLEDKGALNNVYNRLGQQEAAQRASTANSMSARGVGGSGAELAMALEGNAAAQKQRAAATQSIAAQAQKRYLESILQRGQMAGQMNSQDYNQRSQAARAEDLRQQFNSTNAWKRAEYEMKKATGAAGQNPGYANTLENRASGKDKEWAGYGVAGKEAVNGVRGGFDSFKGGGENAPADTSTLDAPVKLDEDETY